MISVFAIMTLASMVNILPVSAVNSVEDNEASFYAPGHLKNFDEDENTNSAKDFAPGINQGRLPSGGCSAPDFAPGQLFKQDRNT